jgi:uncharacterized protein (TIGR02453 family)
MLTPPFTGFGPKALDWFTGLEADNSKAYFETTRDEWQLQVREPLERLLEELAVDLGGTVKVFRQNRDIRFSKDKSPYKTSTYGVVHLPEGESGLYVAISAQGLHAGSGYYQMAKDQLERYRDAVQGTDGANLDAAVEEMEAAGVELHGSALKSAPRGVAKDHPRIRLLRMKDVLAMGRLGPAETLEARRPKDFARWVWDISRPVMAWMDAHVGASTAPPEARGRRP